MTTRLQKVLQRLPEDLQDQVADFAEFLAERRPKQAVPQVDVEQAEDKGHRFSWMGKLQPTYPGETGVELSHAATKWRVESVEKTLRDNR